jgi:hypothetical protein
MMSKPRGVCYCGTKLRRNLIRGGGAPGVESQGQALGLSAAIASNFFITVLSPKPTSTKVVYVSLVAAARCPFETKSKSKRAATVKSHPCTRNAQE